MGLLRAGRADDEYGDREHVTQAGQRHTRDGSLSLVHHRAADRRGGAPDPAGPARPGGGPAMGASVRQCAAGGGRGGGGPLARRAAHGLVPHPAAAGGDGRGGRAAGHGHPAHPAQHQWRQGAGHMQPCGGRGVRHGAAHPTSHGGLDVRSHRAQAARLHARQDHLVHRPAHLQAQPGHARAVRDGLPRHQRGRHSHCPAHVHQHWPAVLPAQAAP